MIKNITVVSLFLCFLGGSAHAQTPIDKTLETFTVTIGGLGLGTAEMDFFRAKPYLKHPEPAASDFREEVLEEVNKNGLTSVIYYFDMEGERPLYELILEFTDAPTREGVAEKLLGPPNYPEKPDHWIAGAQDNVVTVAWAFDNKLVIASSLPGTEWYGDALFNLPPGFELYKHLPHMSEWPAAELARFFDSLEKQVEAGAKEFSTIRSETETDGYYTCQEPLAGAETSNVFKNDNGKWIVGNTMISGANAENSILWKLDAENLLGKTETKKIKLSRTKSIQAFGTTVDVWDVADLTGKPTGVQIGLVHYEWGAEGLWSIDLLVMQE